MITPLIKTRFNLAAKLNFLTILLILVTSAGISIFVFRTESTSYYQELLSHGRTIADMTVPGEVMPFAMVRAGSSFIPSTHEAFRDGDIVEVAVLATAMGKFQQMTTP